MLQTRGKFIKYIIFNQLSMIHKQLSKKHVRPIMKDKPYQKLLTGFNQSSNVSGLLVT